MTNQHVIKTEMIERKETINIYYDDKNIIRKIQLNSQERFIKDFKDINMDVTVIEILPKDNIPDTYFLLPLIDYKDDYEKLIGKEITIIQNIKEKLNQFYGKIKNLTKTNKYEFIHDVCAKEGSSGSPIILKGTKKVIGIHKGFIETNQVKESCGEFIFPIFCYFNNFHNNNLMKNKYNVDKLNIITLIYEFSEYRDTIRLFGDDFVKNNINNCYLILDDQQRKISEWLILDQDQKNNGMLELKLIETSNIINMSCMFSGCTSLNNLPDISEWDMKNVTNMSYMFHDCKSLKSLPDISNWDTKNVKDMSHMFSMCTSLKSLSDISQWDMKNVTNMSYMFYWCRSLESLPDISKWNTNKVTDISFIFCNCISLKPLPDISKRELNESSKKENIFLFCDEKIT